MEEVKIINPSNEHKMPLITKPYDI